MAPAKPSLNQAPLMHRPGDAGLGVQHDGLIAEVRPLPRVHCSGTPALRRPSRMGSSWARYVGSSLCAVQEARRRETV